MTYLVHVLSSLGGLGSRGFNAIVLGGVTAQTTSSRSYLMRDTSRAWNILARVINWFFVGQKDHVRSEWRNEVAHAQWVIEMDAKMNEQRDSS